MNYVFINSFRLVIQSTALNKEASVLKTQSATPKSKIGVIGRHVGATSVKNKTDPTISQDKLSIQTRSLQTKVKRTYVISHHHDPREAKKVMNA